MAFFNLFHDFFSCFFDDNLKKSVTLLCQIKAHKVYIKIITIFNNLSTFTRMFIYVYEHSLIKNLLILVHPFIYFLFKFPYIRIFIYIFIYSFISLILHLSICISIVNTDISCLKLSFDIRIKLLDFYKNLFIGIYSI